MKKITGLILLISSLSAHSLSLSQLRPELDISDIKPLEKSQASPLVELSLQDKLEIAKSLNMRHALEAAPYQAPRSQVIPSYRQGPIYSTGGGIGQEFADYKTLHNLGRN
jgi:hypothetical protein